MFQMTTRSKMCFVIAAIAVVLSSRVCFSADEGDFQWWSTADLSFDISKDWGFTFKEEFRLKENAGHLYHHHSEGWHTKKTVRVNGGRKISRVYTLRLKGNCSALM
jgi:hypothetical protein